ncbi:MAG: DUF2779 domain-containing protein [Halioglobus sp.]
MPKHLSKSKYLAAQSCARKLWLQLWHPELQPEPVGMNKLIMTQGSLFGELAHQLYPEATLIDIDIRNLQQAEADTLAAIEEGADTLLEATFRSGQYRVLSDVVHRLSNGSWHLIEVKSSTRVKAQHIPDLAFQRYVMEQCGYAVSKCSVIYANNAGRLPELASLFVEEDVTAKVAAALPLIAPSLIPIEPLLEEGAECPPVVFSKTCNVCDFKSHCWQGIDRPTIYEAMHANKIPELERQGIFYIDDIPDDAGLEKPLSGKVRSMVECMQQQRVDINNDDINKMLGQLQYPLYFLDFESVAIAMPLFEDSSPWQKYAFQYSLHIQTADGEVEHIEFLHPDKTDPSEAIAKSLVENLGDCGSVIVYHKQMEGGVLKALAKQFPVYGEQLRAINSRLWDLELIFKNHYRHWQWGTRSSIKYVLPTLVPELSYKSLDIQEGGGASMGWLEMVDASNETEQAAKAEALLRYCELDTLAMVRLLAVVKAAVSG